MENFVGIIKLNNPLGANRAKGVIMIQSIF